MLSDRHAVFAAILDDPGDNLPRLAYADWLEEYGDRRDKELANYIRFQIANGRCEKARNVEMHMGCLGDAVIFDKVTEERGFVSAITISHDDWIKYSKRIIRLLPLVEVHFSDRKPLVRSVEDPRRSWFVTRRAFVEGRDDNIDYGFRPYLTGQRRGTSKRFYYDTSDLAVADLSRACILRARKEATPILENKES